jgi:two-component system, CitB family, sensor kinase
MRHRQAYLPEVAETIRNIATAECRDMGVVLHVAKAPMLALPLPEAALVLPAVNLLTNAAKHHYRQENPRAELLFDLEDSGQETPFLILDIRDNGPGIDAKAMERLWQPGYSTAADLEQRRGIGLWLSRKLVEEAGGTIDIQQNWRGAGLWFRLRFPIHLG